VPLAGVNGTGAPLAAAAKPAHASTKLVVKRAVVEWGIKALFEAGV
jgi:hypothetical protein